MRERHTHIKKCPSGDLRVTTAFLRAGLLPKYGHRNTRTYIYSVVRYITHVPMIAVVGTFGSSATSIALHHSSCGHTAMGYGSEVP